MKFNKLNTALALTALTTSPAIFAQEMASVEKQKTNYDAVIEQYDVNKNGELDRDELQAYMSDSQPQATERKGDKVSVVQKPAIVTINQKPAQITVTQPKPEVSITTNDPDISIQQPEPEVTVSQAKPKVNVKTGKPVSYTHLTLPTICSV